MVFQPPEPFLFVPFLIEIQLFYICDKYQSGMCLRADLLDNIAIALMYNLIKTS